MKRRDFLFSAAISIPALGMASCGDTETPPEKNSPNILFCIADDASFPHMSAYGCDWVQTPAFDRVAHNGILFTNAYTANAKCAPSRSCILTGRNSWQLEEAANHVPFFPEKFKVYTESLAGRGYHVGSTGKGWAPGVQGTRNGKQRHLAGEPYNAIKTQPPAAHISPIDYAANFAEFLDKRPDSTPFCFWYGGFEPHRRYEYGAGIEKGGKDIADIDKVFGFWPDNETVRTDMLDYAYEIEYFDKHLAKMLGELEQRNILDNTVVVVTADNGMPFPRIKGQEYEYSNHLPLAVMWPEGIKSPGRIVDDFISFIDFAPTFLELAGIEEQESGMQPITGRSLTDIFNSPKSGVVNPQRDHVLIGKERHDIGRPDDAGYPIRGIVKGRFLYLINFETDRWPGGNPETGYLNTDGSPVKTVLLEGRKNADTFKYWKMSFGKRPHEELYDIANDPDCLNNLIEQEIFRETRNELHSQLISELKQQQDPRVLGNGHIFDEYTYADPNTRDFYNRYMNGEDVHAGWVNPSDFENVNQ